MASNTFVLELCKDPVQFEAAADATVVFDDAHKHLVLSTPDGSLRHLPFFQPRTRPKPITIRGAFKQPKFSVDRKYLSFLSGPNEITFTPLPDAGPVVEFRHKCKASGKDALLSYYWTHANEIILLTRSGLEAYKVVPQKALLKLVKNVSQSVSWFTYSHENRLVFLCSGNATLHGFHFPPNAVVKLPKLELDVSKAAKVVNPADIVIGQLYGALYCIHIYLPRQQVVLYQVGRDEIRKRHTLTLPPTASGALGVSIKDNLLVIHSRDQRVSIIYDVRSPLQGPIVPPLPIAPFLPPEGAAPGGAGSGSIFDRGSTPGIRLYTEDWIFQQPNFVFDKKQGYLWNLGINLEELAINYTDKCQLVDMLMRRAGSKALILGVLKNAVEERNSLATLARLFDMLNKAYSTAVVERAIDVMNSKSRPSGPGADASAPAGGNTSSSARSISISGSIRGLLSPRASLQASPVAVNAGDSDVAAAPAAAGGSEGSAAAAAAAAGGGSAANTSTSSRIEAPASIVYETNAAGYVVIDQADVYTHVFCPVEEMQALDFKYLVAVLMEYIRSLVQYGLKTHHYLFEIAINLLVENGAYYQLHQFLQYHVVSDSDHVACQLLSLEAAYPPAFQLALDMLKRLQVNEDIVEVLLSRGHVMAALRFVRAHKVQHISPARFLRAALDASDDALFHAVYAFLSMRNDAIRGSPVFLPEDECDEFVAEFRSKFGDAAVAAIGAAGGGIGGTAV